MIIPGYCPSCKNYFGSGINIGPNTSLDISQSYFGCPYCGASGRVLDGVYRFIDDVLVVTGNPNFDQAALDALKKAGAQVRSGSITSKQAGEGLERTTPGLFRPLLKWFNSAVGAAYVGMAVSVAIYVHQAYASRSNEPTTAIAERAIEELSQGNPEGVAPKQSRRPPASVRTLADSSLKEGHAKAPSGKPPYKNRHERRRDQSMNRSKK